MSSTARVALGVALILSLPLVAMQFTEQVDWSAADFAAAAVLLAAIGAALELARKRSGSLALAVGTGVLGLGAALFGSADDAPGLVLLGLALVAGGAALAWRIRS